MAITGALQNDGGGNGSESESGLVTRTATFKCDYEEEALFGGPEFWLGFGQKKGGRSWSPRPGGGFMLKLIYEGLKEGVDSGESWKWSRVKTEEPLAAHPYVELLIDRFGGTEEEDGSIKFPRFLPEDFKGGPDGLAGQNLNRNGEGKIKNPMFGWESYLKIGLKLTRSFTLREFPLDLVRQSDTVVDEVPNPTYNIFPERDWLVSLGDIEERGEGELKIYTGSVDYLLSLEGGWPPLKWLIDRLV